MYLPNPTPYTQHPIQYKIQNQRRLYIKSNAHAQEAACATLLQLSEPEIQRYLLQIVYLAVARPSTSLERAVVELCRRSLSIALRVTWLLLALHQDQPSNRHLALFREKTECAALDGRWVSAGLGCVRAVHRRTWHTYSERHTHKGVGTCCLLHNERGLSPLTPRPYRYGTSPASALNQQQRRHRPQTALSHPQRHPQQAAFSAALPPPPSPLPSASTQQRRGMAVALKPLPSSLLSGHPSRQLDGQLQPAAAWGGSG